MGKPTVQRLTLECGHFRISGSWDSPLKDDDKRRHVIGDIDWCEVCPRAWVPHLRRTAMALRQIVNVEVVSSGEAIMPIEQINVSGDRPDLVAGELADDDQLQCRCSRFFVCIEGGEPRFSLSNEDGTWESVPCTARVTGEDHLCDPCRAGCVIVRFLNPVDSSVPFRRHAAPISSLKM